MSDYTYHYKLLEKRGGLVGATLGSIMLPIAGTALGAHIGEGSSTQKGGRTIGAALGDAGGLLASNLLLNANDNMLTKLFSALVRSMLITAGYHAGESIGTAIDLGKNKPKKK